MLVIDACITVRWVVKEDGTLEALALRQKAKLIAPELLVAECANILWKKIQRGEFLREEALLCARLFQGPKSSSCPRGLYLKPRLRTSIEVEHPSFECLCLALAVEKNVNLFQQTNALLRLPATGRQRRLRGRAISLVEAVKL